MSPRTPLTFPGRYRSLDNLNTAMKHDLKRPPIGLTQGGSSRKDRGAKVAATDGQYRPTKPRT